jgi:hypothetical protein
MPASSGVIPAPHAALALWALSIRRFAAAAAGLLVLGAACCSFEPTNCAEAACDTATTYCIVFGSDVAAVPNSASCRAYPEDCGADPDCDCVLAEQPEIATCAETALGIEVVIPGG